MSTSTAGHEGASADETPIELEAALSQLAKRLTELTSTLARTEEQRDAYKKAFELAQLELERLRRSLFGRKAERVDPAQVALAFEPFRKLLAAAQSQTPLPTPETQTAAAPEPATPSAPPPGARAGKKPPTPHGKRNIADLEHLPVEEIRLVPPNLPPGAVEMEGETSWRLEWRRAHHVRLKIVRPKFIVPQTPEQKAHSGADTTVVIDDVPDEMVPRGIAGPALLAHVLVQKFADHIPFHRQEQILERQGLALDRGTMCRWTQTCHSLACRLVEAMVQDALDHATVIATDATGVLVQHEEACRRGHFFVAIADQDHVFFRYTPRQTSAAVKELFPGFQGYLQADAAHVYDALFRQDDGPLEVGCWAHARRKFYESIRSDRQRALVALGFLHELFAIDRDLRALPPARRLEARRARAAPLLRALADWKDKLLADRTLAPRSPLARALRYLDRQWTPLTRFLEDPRLRLDNNPSELELRRLVVGRKNWLFVGSDDTAPATCTFVSLVASCKLHRLDPEAYLRDLFRVLPAWPTPRLLELAPKHWRATRSRLLDRELDAPLGPLSIPPTPPPKETAQNGDAA